MLRVFVCYHEGSSARSGATIVVARSEAHARELAYKALYHKVNLSRYFEIEEVSLAEEHAKIVICD